MKLTPRFAKFSLLLEMDAAEAAILLRFVALAEKTLDLSDCPGFVYEIIDQLRYLTGEDLSDGRSINSEESR